MKKDGPMEEGRSQTEAEEHNRETKEKETPNWRRRSKRRNGRRCDGPDLPGASKAQCAARVTYAGHGVSDVIEMRSAGRAYKRGKRKHAHLVLRGNAEEHVTLKTSGEGGSGGDAHEESRWPEAARNACLGESVQAPPNVRKAWRPPEVANNLRHRRIHFRQLEEAGGGEVDQRIQYMPLEEVLVTQGDGPHKRRMPTQ